MRDLDSAAPARRGARARLLGIVLFVGLVVVPLVSVAVASTRLFRPGGRALEVELVAKGGRYAQIFWSADFAMSPNDSSLAMLHPQGVRERSTRSAFHYRKSRWRSFASIRSTATAKSLSAACASSTNAGRPCEPSIRW